MAARSAAITIFGMGDYQAPSTDNTEFKSLGMGNLPLAKLPCLGIF